MTPQLGTSEAAHRYALGSHLSTGSVIDGHQVKTNKPSGSVSDRNDLSRKVVDPRYVLSLLNRVLTVSLDTMSVHDVVPPLAIREDQNPA